MPCQNKTLSRTCKQEMAAYNAHHRFKYEVLSVRVRKGKHISELLQLGFIYTKVSFKIIHDDTCILVNICMQTKRF